MQAQWKKLDTLTDNKYFLGASLLRRLKVITTA